LRGSRESLHFYGLEPLSRKSLLFTRTRRAELHENDAASTTLVYTITPNLDVVVLNTSVCITGDAVVQYCIYQQLFTHVPQPVPVI
jgi:hypothetical protein